MTNRTRASLNWQEVGRCIYRVRVMRGESQEKLARLAGLGVSTIYHAERGKPIGQSSLRKICAVFDMPVEELLQPKKTLSRENRVLVHLNSSCTWIVAEDLRTSIPSDDFSRIQSAEERLRLGRLGLVAAFCTTPTFIMPNGPGQTFVEVFNRFEGGINDDLYREATIRCEQGRVRFCIADKVVELGVGDMVAYYSKDLQWTEPVDLGDLPVVFTWTGAVRVGSPPPSG